MNELLRKQWRAAGYDRGHGSDAVLPPASAGFKRLYYLTGPEHALSNIVFGRVKISRFSELNDPFELLGQHFNDARTRKLISDHKKSFDANNGLICFSEDWTDPVLWSHYASKHKGMALGFDISDSLVKPIQYSSQRLKQNFSRGTSNVTRKLEELLVYTKYESWQYEREWRLLYELSKADREGGLYFIQFGAPIKLVEVILGPSCDFNLKKIRDMVDTHHKGVVTYKARLANRSFRIIPNGASVVSPKP
ncbi:MAG TPA: DUF2971 domain-containing protein [Methylocystis sp.]